MNARPRSWLPWLIAAPLALAGGTSAAQPAEFALADDGARVTRLSESVYVIEHDDATDEWPHGNTGVIVGQSGVLVIDSCYLPSRARADIALIRRITDKPVRFLVTTHWHFDHNNGAIAYREAFPDVTLIAERNTARWLVLNQQYWQRLSAAPDSARRASLATLESELARGAGEDGIRFDDTERARRESIVLRRRQELQELESLAIVTPTRLFDDRISLDLGGLRVEIEDRGPANSPNDTTVWLPHERILFAGDILVRSPLPYVGASWPVHWAKVLRDIESVRVAALVPGHGPVMKDHGYTRDVRTLMEATLVRVEAMVRAGRTLAQVQDELTLDDIRARVPEWNGPGVSEEDWTYTRRTLAERAFVGLRGQGGL
jgi:glyoxylase-like metal-dependent hydrolase (beta-lactamase superfamily II)